ncbi:hypothetical protein [Undibacterium squillarum]|uniref:hypothetical protein n=1 Tax=Undibacterium squillarum TaxID=1131567 RepID=UPI0035B4D41B
MSLSANGRDIDVFNGDADGICAVHQWRMAFPADSELVTGAKRDIGLLQTLNASAGDSVNVFDISFDQNIHSIRRLLDAGVTITYFDHHSANNRFEHPGLTMHWDEHSKVCSSILVNNALGGRYPEWAIVAAFGDNLSDTARKLAASVDLSDHQAGQLCELGKLLNYNAYGESLADLHFHPALLYAEVSQFKDPFELIAEASAFRTLQRGYHSDRLYLNSLTPAESGKDAILYVLPDQSWARRISGEFANQLAADHPSKSCAVIVPKANAAFVVSIRSARPELYPASTFCERFPTGGGRRGAGGINVLPASELDHFVRLFFQYFSC